MITRRLAKMNTLSIYLAEDHNIVAQGIANLLKQVTGGAEVTVFKNGKELFEACGAHLPGLVFLDVEMPVWDGRKTLIHLKKHYPGLPCFMLSMLNEKYIVQDCMEKGASGYLSKDCTLDELNEAVSLSPSGIYYSKEVLKVLSGMETSTLPGSHHISLSDREKEILSLLCDGYSPREIAEQLFLSARTVETHKTNVMQKMEVKSVGKLISVALKNKMV